MKRLLSNLTIGSVVAKKTIDAPFEQVFEALQDSIRENNFSIPAVHDLKKTFQKAKLPLDKDFEYRIVQLCNAQKSHKVLTSMSYDMGIMMPKSIIIAWEKGKTTLRFMQMKPWIMGMMFPEINIAPMSRTVMSTMRKIVNDTADKFKS